MQRKSVLFMPDCKVPCRFTWISSGILKMFLPLLTLMFQVVGQKQQPKTPHHMNTTAIS